MRPLPFLSNPLRRRARQLLCCAGLLALPACLLPAAARAETSVFVGNISPYSYPPEHGERGVLFELMHELALRTGHSGEVQVVPLGRELEFLRTNTDAVGVLARVPDREALYSWVAPLLRDRMLLVTRAESTVDISSLAAARELRVGVLLGGPAESVARRVGFRHVEATISVGNNVRKLAANRLDALLLMGGVAAAEEALPAGQSLNWREGAVIGYTTIYVAGNTGFAPASAGKWQAALKTMQQDGSYQRILAHYHFAAAK